jgi:hypothetical protein
VVACVRQQLVHGSYVDCLLDLLMYDFATHRRIVEGGGRLSYLTGPNLSAPRNEVVRKFLAFGKADWLWMVDTDMVFPPDTVERLLDYADPVSAPIVGGLCFGLTDDGQVLPTLFDLVGEESADTEWVRYSDWKPDTMMQVAATGAACLLVHKSVFETIRDFEHPNRGGRPGFNDAFPWFQEVEHNGRPVSEDITFCARAGWCNIPVFVNTAVQIGHIKDRLLTMESYFLARGLLAPAHVGVGV